MPVAQKRSPVSESPQANALSFTPSPAQLIALLACYFVLQIVVRVTCSSSVDLDESEAIVLAQKFRWGYGSDPPLYTWLQVSFFAIFGQSVLGLSVLKNLLLLSTYLLTFATARLVTRWESAAVAAALSLLYLPQVAWESQRDLTHSVLSATFSVGTLFCFLHLLASRRLVWYILLGVCAGFGVLSKYNYALWLLGLLFAGLSIKQFRPTLLDWRLLLSFGVALLIFLPNGLWVLENRELALLTSTKFEVNQSLSWLQVSRMGLKNVVQSILSFTTPLTLIYLLFFLKPPRRPVAAPEPVFGYRTLILRAWLIIGLVLICLIMLARATGFKERWFQPILVMLPILAISLVQQRLTALRLKCILALSLTVMLAVALIMPGRLLAAERLKREEPLTRPYAKLAGELRPSIPPGSLVVCDTRLLAGNLRLGLPQATILSPELTPIFRNEYPHCFLAWDARRDEVPPQDLKRWAEANRPPLAPTGPPIYYEAVYRYHKSKQFRLGLLQLY